MVDLVGSKEPPKVVMGILKKPKMDTASEAEDGEVSTPADDNDSGTWVDEQRSPIESRDHLQSVVGVQEGGGPEGQRQASRDKPSSLNRSPGALLSSYAPVAYEFDLDEYDNRVQLTVSSINTILEDLPEGDDDDEDASRIETEKKQADGQEEEKETEVVEKGEVKTETLVDLPKSCGTNETKFHSRIGGGLTRGPPLTLSTRSQQSRLIFTKQNSLPMQGPTRAAGNSSAAAEAKASGANSTPSSRRNSGDTTFMHRPSSSGLKGRTPSGGDSSTRTRDRSPCVSFDETPIIVQSATRQRSRSDGTKFKFRSPSSSISSSTSKTASSTSAVGGARSKMAWLRDRQRSRESLKKEPIQQKSNETNHTEGNQMPTEDAFIPGRDGEIAEMEDKIIKQLTGYATGAVPKKKINLLMDVDKPPKRPRPRTKSDKLDRTTKKAVVNEVSQMSSFDWPLGRLGKLKQKYQRKKNSLKVKSASEVALSQKSRESSHGYYLVVGGELRRRHSERHKGGRAVGFEDTRVSLASSLWSASMRFLLGDSRARSGRRRHLSDSGLAYQILLDHGKQIYIHKCSNNELKSHHTACRA